MNADYERCGSFGCTLPKDHNMGRMDVPENHQIAESVRPVDLAQKLAEALIALLDDDTVTADIELAVKPFAGHRLALVRVRLGG